MSFDPAAFLRCLIVAVSLVRSAPLNSQDSYDLKRLYIYFDGLPVSDSELFVKSETYTKDGKNDVNFAHMVSSIGISDKRLDNRIWFVDVKSDSYLACFSVGPLGYESLPPWSSMGEADVITGSSYIYHQLPSYVFQNDSSWRPIGLTMAEFADYILSRIDPYSANEVNGCLTFDDLEGSFYSAILDYDAEQAKNIVWNDKYLGREVSLSEKWNILKDEFNKTYEKTAVDLWPYFAGSFVLIGAFASLFGVVSWYVRKKS